MKHRKRNRLSGYNYTHPGFYFVTICTKNRKHFFGGIHNGIMCINRLGSIAWRQWTWLETQYDYVRSHAFVVMPNHVHGILEITEPTSISVGAGRDLPLPEREYAKIKPLSELIGAYKMTTSKLIHDIPYTSFTWQRSFHDHIIKNQRAFNNIRRYIITNPSMWDRDRNNT
jgi:REP element-mobilizing transposase RayT